MDDILHYNHAPPTRRQKRRKERRAKGKAQKAFMKEYHEHTEHWSVLGMHSIDKKERTRILTLKCSYYNHRPIIVQGYINLTPYNHKSFSGILLEKVLCCVKGRRKGWGTNTMDWLCELADKHKLPMILEVVPITKSSEEAMNVEQLVQWYKRFGFHVVVKDDYPLMYRDSRDNVKRETYA